MNHPFTRAYVVDMGHTKGSEPHSPKTLPRHWQECDLGGASGFWYRDGLKVICSISEENDGLRWLHVSLSRPKQIPTWDDVKAVKSIFIGRDEKAIMVFPAAREWINHNPHVLHLWRCLEADLLPDFRKGGTI